MSSIKNPVALGIRYNSNEVHLLLSRVFYLGHRSTGKFLHLVRVSSEVECALHCARAELCSSYDYREPDHHAQTTPCQLNHFSRVDKVIESPKFVHRKKLSNAPFKNKVCVTNPSKSLL